MEKEAIVAPYLVKADYLKILENLYSDKEKMQLVYIFMDFNVKSFIKSEEFTSQLFFLSEINEPEVITSYLLGLGFRPAYFKEMLAFLSQYPDFKKIPIVALGSGAWFNERDYFHCTSYSEKNKWKLGYHCFTCCLKENNKKSYILAVKI